LQEDIDGLDHVVTTLDEVVAAAAGPSEDQSLEWLQKETKICPNPGCIVILRREGGCKHITCSRCG